MAKKVLPAPKAPRAPRAPRAPVVTAEIAHVAPPVANSVVETVVDTQRPMATVQRNGAFDEASNRVLPRVIRTSPVAAPTIVRNIEAAAPVVPPPAPAPTPPPAAPVPQAAPKAEVTQVAMSPRATSNAVPKPVIQESRPLTAPAPQAGAQPAMRILGQYLKDFSFENPNAPLSLTPQEGQPDINIQVDVNANNVGPNDFEVELHIEAKATNGGKTLFASDVLYAGLFKLENFPQNALHAAVLIECPRMLFPFARQILADATRNGGFPPLMLDPIDFAQMYLMRMKQAENNQA